MKEPCDSNTKIKGEAAAPPKRSVNLVQRRSSVAGLTED